MDNILSSESYSVRLFGPPVTLLAAELTVTTKSVVLWTGMTTTARSTHATMARQEIGRDKRPTAPQRRAPATTQLTANSARKRSRRLPLT